MLIQNPLNTSVFAFPLLESIHVIGMMCGVGTAAVVNLRLLGIGLTQTSAARLWREAMPWMLSGLTLAIFSGLLLFSIDPEKYFGNYIFRWKMLCLVLAVVFYFTAVRRAARTDKGTVAAVVSLALWALVPFGGIFIGFVA